MGLKRSQPMKQKTFRFGAVADIWGTVKAKNKKEAFDKITKGKYKIRSHDTSSYDLSPKEIGLRVTSKKKGKWLL